MFRENPEAQAIHNIDSENRPKLMARIRERVFPQYHNTSEILERHAVDPNNFIPPHGRYDPISVANDLKYVEEMRRKHKMADEKMDLGFGLTGIEVHQLAEILEYQILVGLNKYGWFPHCKAIKSSTFDDIHNGVDAIIEYKGSTEVSHLGLAMDVSFSNNLDKKLQRIKDDIDHFDGEKNRLTEVRYFHSTNSGYKGELHNIARVVAAVDVPVIEDLANHTNLGNHMIRHELIMSSVRQLSIFAEYAELTKSDCVHHLRRAKQFMSLLAVKAGSEEALQQSTYTKNAEADKALSQGLKLFS